MCVPAHFRHVPEVRDGVDEIDEREEERRHDAVGDHLVDGARDSRLVQRRHPEHHDSHVGHRGVRDQVLDVLLPAGAQSAVNDVDHRDEADEPRELMRGLGKEPEADTQDAVRAQLHQDARVHHRPGGGRRGVPVRRPGMEGPDAGQNAETDVEEQEERAAQAAREGRLRQRYVVECAAAQLLAPLDPQEKDADEDERRPGQEVQRQLHGAISISPKGPFPGTSIDEPQMPISTYMGSTASS